MVIKEYKKDRFTLVHEHIVDDFGLLQDAFTIRWKQMKDNQEVMMNAPVFGIFKVTNYKRDEHILGGARDDYTDDDYDQIMVNGLRSLGLWGM